MEVARSGLGYQCKMAGKDRPIVSAMRNYSRLYPRFGSRRIRIFLARDGIRIGRDRSARIWAAAGLQVPAKKPRKRYRSHRPQPFAATAPNEVWAYDFVFDGCGNGQKLKCLTLIDEFTKESLAIDVAGTIRITRVVKVLIDQWRKHYISVRPHSSLGYQTPIEFASGWGNVSITEARISS